MMKKNKKMIMVMLGIIFLTGSSVFAEVSSIKNYKTCTKELKVCSDGTVVGRGGIDCQFKVCPEYTEKAKPELMKADVFQKACALIYNPVCGFVDGVVKNFPNKCVAENSGAKEISKESCNLKNIKIVVDKKGLENNKNKKEKEIIKPCSKEYNPVCGKVNTGIRCVNDICPPNVFKTFSNKCIAINARAGEIVNGVCKQSLKKLPNIKNSFITRISEASTEEERRKIIAVSDNNLIDKKTNINKKTLIETKRKHIIESRSNEIFSQIDIFSNKMNDILDKLENKNNYVYNNKEVEKLIKLAKEKMISSSEEKAMAWIEFSSLAESKTKENATEKIKKVKILYNNSKRELREALTHVRNIIIILK